MDDSSLSPLQRLLAELNVLPVYAHNGRTFYDTRELFDRHNFTRDVRRTLHEDEWVIAKTKYYLSEQGIVTFAFCKAVGPVMERIMRILTTVTLAPPIEAPLLAPYYPYPQPAQWMMYAPAAMFPGPGPEQGPGPVQLFQ